VQFATILAVAVAGAFGATSRFLLTAALRQLFGDSPWPIATINVLGCFGFGVIWSLAQDRLSATMALCILVGFFGSFTTFSAFAYDCQVLLAERKFGMLLSNMLLQNALGILALWLGMQLVAWRS
jgi:fluoride exporter